MSTIRESYLTPKGKTLRAQVIELQKFKYDKIQKGEPRKNQINGLKGKNIPFFYKYKDKFLNDIEYDIIVYGINRMSGKTRVTLGKKIMNFYCEFAQRDPATARIVLSNLNGPEWNNIQRISKKIDTDMGSPIISRSNKEAMTFFVNDNERHFNKDEKVYSTVSIYATKNAKVLIFNERYRNFLGGAHPNHYIPFLEDVLYGAKKKNKLEELDDGLNTNNIKLTSVTKIPTVSYQCKNT